MGITHVCFGLSYLTAFGLEMLRQFRPSRTIRASALLFTVAGLVAQTVFLIVHQPNPASASGAMLLLAWVLAIFSLYGSLHHYSQSWSLFVLPVVVVLVGISLAYYGQSEDAGSWFSPEHFWGTVHGIFVLAASVGITVAFLASVMYLLQVRRLRMKKSPFGGLRLLSLERLETMNRRAINLAFPMLTIGLLLGVVRGFSTDAQAADWTAAKVLGTVGLWAVALILLYLRYAASVPPRRLALITILAFALMLLTLVQTHPFVTEGGR
jgi:ABC-type transport system involved in cytochrome c biogenesis permease subunit